MNIDSYNVRVTSLEEVFNSLGEEEMAKHSTETLSANELDAEDRALDGQPMPFKNVGFFQYFGILLGWRMTVVKRKVEFLNYLITPIICACGMVYGLGIASNANKSFGLVPIQDPVFLYNSTTATITNGLYKIGFQTEDQVAKGGDIRFDHLSLENNICPGSSYGQE